MWDGGFTEYIHDWWNLMDFAMNSLYLATISLKIVAYVKVRSFACTWVRWYLVCTTALLCAGRYSVVTSSGRCTHLTLQIFAKGFVLFNFNINVLFKRSQTCLSHCKMVILKGSAVINCNLQMQQVDCIQE